MVAEPEGTASLVPLALIPRWEAAGIAYVGLYMGAMIVDAAFNVFSQEAVPAGWRPTMAGVSLTAEGASRTLVGIVGGLVIVALGYKTMFLAVAVIAAAAGLIFWVYFRPSASGEAAAPRTRRAPRSIE